MSLPGLNASVAVLMSMFPLFLPSLNGSITVRQQSLSRPAGSLNVYDEVQREVMEETGLRVTSFYPDIGTKTHAPKEDDCFTFIPFCCQQQLKGGLP
jgi:hypothetical protein